MLLSSSAPLPNNTLTPIPQAWLDAGNARIGMLTLLANRAKSITDCYAPASSFIESSGPVVAASVAQVQALASGDASAVPSAGESQSNVPPPVVLSLNPISLGTPGGGMVAARSACSKRRAASPQQPQMMMPQPAPAVLPAPTPQPIPPSTQSSYPAPQWTNLCWAMRNGAVLQSQFAPGDYNALDWACSQKGYVGACPPPPDVEAYLLQGSLPQIPVSQAVIDAIPNAPPLGGVSCPQSYVMAGLSGIAPPWGSYARSAGDGGDLLSVIRHNPVVALLAVGVGLWGLSQAGKGRR